MTVVFDKHKLFHLTKGQPQFNDTESSTTNGFDYLRWANHENSEVKELEPEKSGNESEEEEQESQEKKKKPSKEERKALRRSKRLQRQKHAKQKKKDKEEESEYEELSLSMSSGSPLKDRIHYIKSLYLGLINQKDDRILSYHDIKVYKATVMNLGYDQWLNDDNLLFVYEYLEHVHLKDFIEENPQLVNSKHSKRFMNSILLIKPSIGFLLLKFPDPRALKGTLPPLELASFLFIPVNDNDDVEQAEGGSHWSLVVVSMLESKAYIYDTLAEEPDEGNYPESLQLIENLNLYLSSILPKMRPIVPVVEKTPQQVNGSDCGVHVLQITAILLSRMIYNENRPILFQLSQNLHFNAVEGRVFILELIRRLVHQEKASL